MRFEAWTQMEAVNCGIYRCCRSVQPKEVRRVDFVAGYHTTRTKWDDVPDCEGERTDSWLRKTCGIEGRYWAPIVARNPSERE